MRISIIPSTICILALSNAFLMRIPARTATTTRPLHLFHKKHSNKKQQSAQDFEEYVMKSINSNKDDVIETVAVKFLNFLLGDWDAHVNVAIEKSSNSTTEEFMSKLDSVKLSDNDKVEDKLEDKKTKPCRMSRKVTDLLSST